MPIVFSYLQSGIKILNKLHPTLNNMKVNIFEALCTNSIKKSNFLNANFNNILVESLNINHCRVGSDSK